MKNSMNNINDKNSPNQMRIFMKRMREGYVVEGSNTAEVRNPSMRDMLKITRKLNEGISNDNNEIFQDKKIESDQKREEDSMRELFTNDNVSFTFGELTVKYKNNNAWYVIFGGVVDGVIQFTYKVTPDEQTSGVEFTYLPGFNHDNPDNDEIIKKLETHYDSFFRYWKENILQQ